MSGFRQAFDDGRRAVQERFAQGTSYDPAGEGHDQSRLRGMGKWRFILVRGMVGFGVPMFLFLAFLNFSKDVHAARDFHQSTLRYLFGHWIFGYCMSTCLGFVVGVLAWRRLVSETWPGTQPDPESCTTTLGPLRRR
jgi:hypothetical protein